MDITNRYKVKVTKEMLTVYHVNNFDKVLLTLPTVTIFTMSNLTIYQKLTIFTSKKLRIYQKLTIFTVKVKNLPKVNKL